MTETIITVQGEHDVRRAAECGTVQIHVAFDGPAREDTLARATQRHAELVSGLRELEDAGHGPVLRWSSDRLRVWGDRPWSQTGEQLPVVHHAQIAVEAEFGDTTALSDWVASVSVRDGVTVEGVSWALSEQTRRELADRVARLAVEDAVARARRYAEALGLTELRPLAVSDPGLLHDAETSPRPSAAFPAKLASADAGGASLALKPTEIRVAAQVHARFAAS